MPHTTCLYRVQRDHNSSQLKGSVQRHDKSNNAGKLIPIYHGTVKDMMAPRANDHGHATFKDPLVDIMTIRDVEHEHSATRTSPRSMMAHRGHTIMTAQSPKILSTTSYHAKCRAKCRARRRLRASHYTTAAARHDGTSRHDGTRARTQPPRT